MSNGSGGSGGTINASPKPNIANPAVFVFLNGNSGTTGSTSSTPSATNANVGVGGAGSSTGGATGGSGGSGAYVKVIYNGGLVNYTSNLAYTIGSAGSSNGANGGVRITWT